MTIRTIDFRYRVLRNGGDYCEIYPVGDSMPAIEMNDEGEIKTSLTGEFIMPQLELNWLTDEILPEMTLNGETRKLGRFLAARVEEQDDGITKSLHIEAYDRGWLVRDSRAESRPFFAAETNYLDAIGSALVAAGITDIREVPTDAVLTEDREDWECGTSWLEVANQLLREINYKDVWFDAEGVCILEPVPMSGEENIDHVLDESSVESMMSPGGHKTTDYYATPNVFICICSNADKADAMVAVAENVNPESPLSIPRRGRRISTVIQINNIASMEELQLFAERQVVDSLRTGEIIQIETALLPGFGVGDITALRYNGELSLCKERGWIMQLGVGGKMTHTLEKVVYNLG